MAVFDKISNLYSNYFSNNIKAKASNTFIEVSSHSSAKKTDYKADELIQKCETYLKKQNYQGVIDLVSESGDFATKSQGLRILTAKSYFALQQYDDALNEYNEVLDLNPDSLEAGIGISQIYLKTDKYKQAIELLTGLIEKSNNDKTLLKKLSNAYYQFGNKLAKKQDYKTAISKYTSALQYEDNSLIYYALGLCHKSLQDFESAEKNFNKALNSLKDDKKSSCLIQLAEIYESNKQNSKAIEFYNQALELEEKPEWKDFIKGKVFFNKKYFEHAIKYYKAAIQTSPSFVKALSALAELSEQMQNYQEALINYEKIIKLDKNNLDANIKAALLYYKTGKKDTALQRFQSLILSIGSENAECNRYFAKLLLEKGKTDDAIKKINKSIMINNKDYESYLILSNCYHNQKNIRKAFSESEKAISIAPDNSETIKHHGKLLVEMDKTEEALKLFEKAAEIFPKDKDICIYICEIFRKNKDYKKAIEKYKNFLKIIPSNPEITLNIAICFFENSDFKNALLYLEKIPDKDNYSMVYFYLSQTYREIKKNGKAIENIEQFIRFNPGNANALIYAGKLYEEQNNMPNAIEYYKRAMKIDFNNTEVVNLLKKAQDKYFKK